LLVFCHDTNLQGSADPGYEGHHWKRGPRFGWLRQSTIAAVLNHQKELVPECANYYVVTHQNGWAIQVRERLMGPFKTKKDAMKVAKRLAAEDQPSQVIVEGHESQWQEDSFFGDGPAPSERL
jgi:hypothetical protein